MRTSCELVGGVTAPDALDLIDAYEHLLRIRDGDAWDIVDRFERDEEFRRHVLMTVEAIGEIELPERDERMDFLAPPPGVRLRPFEVFRLQLAGAVWRLGHRLLPRVCRVKRG